MSDSATPWTAAHQASLFITSSQSLLKFMSIKLVIHPTISSSVIPFSSCLQSFPASGSSLMSWLFASGGESIGASVSASVLPMISFRMDWFDLLAILGTQESSPAGVGCHVLLQGIFPTQELNPGLPNCWLILYHLSHEGCPNR